MLLYYIEIAKVESKLGVWGGIDVRHARDPICLLSKLSILTALPFQKNFSTTLGALCMYYVVRVSE